MRLLALAVALVLVAGCSKKETPPPLPPGVSRNAAPTCDKARFQEAIDRFDVLVKQRDEAIRQVEGYEINEYYERTLDVDLPKVAALVVKANAVSVPKCLEAARDTLATMMQQTYDALDQRRPSRGMGGYAAGRVLANRSYDEYLAEVQAQTPNAR